MNKPNPEFEIDEPTVVDDQGRSPNKEEVIDPDAHDIEADANRPGEQPISNRPQDEQDEDANGNESASSDDSESEDGLSASDSGEAGNLGRDAGATQGNQKMDGGGEADRRPVESPGHSHANPINTQKKQQQGPGAGSNKRSVN